MKSFGHIPHNSKADLTVTPAESEEDMFNMYFVTCKGKHNTQKKIIYARNIKEAKEEAQKRLDRDFCKYWNMLVTDVEFVKAL